MTKKYSLSDLRTYEIYIPRGTPFVEWLFKILLFLILTASIFFGLFLTTVKPVKQEIYSKISELKTQFIIQEKKRITKKVEKKKPKKIIPQKIEKKKTEEKPIDLTKKPELKKKEDDIKKNVKKVKKVRRIYGLKKVYSKGIGTGGSLSDAVIGKTGNTLNKDIDTITATEEELKGEVVSVTTITIQPKYKKRVKPEYSQEMLDNSVEGVVKVKVLVDIDGKVKKAIVLNDIGYGAAERARQACFKALFEPAKRDGVPVAVWIIIPIRFVILG
jgi:protein TonB